MTRDKLMALRRTCPKCNGSGLWHEIYINGDGLADEDGGECSTCLGTGYVLPATAEVLGNAEPRTVCITEPVCINIKTLDPPQIRGVNDGDVVELHFREPQWIYGRVVHITINRNCEEADDAG